MILGSATLTIVVSRMTMKALSAITTSACQWYGMAANRAPRPAPGRAPRGCATVAIASRLPRQRKLRAGLADLDADLHRGAERQHHPARIHGDLDRHVLGDLGEIPRGVV